MRIAVVKLRCGDLIIGRVVDEDKEKVVMEKVCKLESNLMYHWLFAVENPDQRVTIHTYDMLLPPMAPKKELEQKYLEYTSGLSVPRQTPPPPPPGYGGVPPTRGGGGVPPTRGGLM